MSLWHLELSWLPFQLLYRSGYWIGCIGDDGVHRVLLYEIKWSSVRYVRLRFMYSIIPSISHFFPNNSFKIMSFFLIPTGFIDKM